MILIKNFQYYTLKIAYTDVINTILLILYWMLSIHMLLTQLCL